MSIAISGSTITFADLSTQTTAPISGVSFKNKIINGAMRFDQRNAGAAVTVNTGGPAYTLDRWFAYQNSPSTLVQVSRDTSAPSGFRNSIKWGRNGAGTAGGVTVLGQAVETENSIDLQGNIVTLSFYAKAGANFSGASSQIGVTLYTGTDIDQSVGSMVTNAWTGTAKPINSAATLTTSWQRFSFTSTTLGATVSQVGMTFSWATVGTAGADDNVYITGVQLERSPNASEFECTPVGPEFAVCQRYFEKQTNNIVRGGGPGGFAWYAFTFYKVQKRTAANVPVVTITSSANVTFNSGPYNYGTNGFEYNINTSIGSGAGYAIFTYTVDAEL
jgi:hypothetical protein